jgi:ureidoacrylate peracid hydrolase
VPVGGGYLDDLVQTLNEGGALGLEMIVPTDAADPSAQHHQRMWRTRATLTTTAEAVADLRSARTHASAPGETALIVVDLQNDFVHPQGVRGRLGYSKMSEEERSILIENNQALCEAMREAGHPVIFARVGVRKDNLDRAWSKSIRRELPIEQDEGYLAEGSWGAQVVEGVDIADSDIMVTKKGNSAFGLTPLHRILRNLNVTSCVVSGGAVHGCIEATVREGVGLGYTFTIVPDAAYPPSSLVSDVLGNQTDFKTTAEVIDELG